MKLTSNAMRKHLYSLLFFSLVSLGICASQDVTITASGLSTNVWYTPITIKIVNKSTTPITSVTASVASVYIDTGSSNTIDWNNDCTCTTKNNVTTFTDVFSSPVLPGTSVSIKGGINLNGSGALTSRSFTFSYNGGGGDPALPGSAVYTLSVSSGAAPEVTVPVKIGSNTYNMKFGTNDALSLSAGTYNVAVSSFTSGGVTYDATSYNSKIAISSNAADKESIVFTPESTPTPPSPSGKVNITVSGLSDSNGWSGITTAVANESDSEVSSVQMMIPSQYFSDPSNPGCINWWPASTSSVKGTYVVFNVDLSSNRIAPGKTLSMSGGLQNLSRAIDTSSILTGYNNLGGKIGYVNFNLSSCPASSPVVTVGTQTYNLTYGQNTVITLPAGTYNVSMADLYYGNTCYRPSGYASQITVANGQTLTENVTFPEVQIEKVNALVTVADLPGNTSAPITISSTSGYSDSTQKVINGTNSLSIPSNGTFTITFGSASSYSPHPTSLTVINGQFQGASSIDYEKVIGLKVGYWTIWSRTPIQDAVDAGYDTIVVAFGEVNGNSISIPFEQYGSYTSRDFINEVSKAKANGLKHVIVSVGGANNTFNTKGADVNTLASKIVKFCDSIGADGIDFDLEISESELHVNLHSLIKAMRAIEPNFIVTAAPQLDDCGNGNIQLVSSGNDQIYNEAVAAGDFDYLFVQLYNTGGYTIDGYSELDPQFIPAAFNYLKKNIVKPPTKIVPGEPSCANGGGSETIYHNRKYSTQQEVWNAVKTNVGTIYSDSSFGGVMDWSINLDAGNGYGFARTVFWK